MDSSKAQARPTANRFAPGDSRRNFISPPSFLRKGLSRYPDFYSSPNKKPTFINSLKVGFLFGFHYRDSPLPCCNPPHIDNSYKNRYDVGEDVVNCHGKTAAKFTKRRATCPPSFEAGEIEDEKQEG